VDDQRFPDSKNTQFIGQILPASYKESDIYPSGMGNRDNFGPLYIPAKGDTLFPGKSPLEIIQNTAKLAHHKFTYMNHKMYIDDIAADFYIVEQDHYFMMGDNRHNSLDSRFWGLVPFDLILGEGLVIYLSWNKNPVPLHRFYEKIRWRRIGTLIK